MGRQMRLCGEKLWEVLVHPLRDGPMLPTSKGRQQAPVPLGILPDLRQSLADILTQLSQLFRILKLLVHPDISPVIGQPARAVSPIVRDIEWLISLGGGSHLCCCHGIGKIYASQSFILGE